jgi:hypothetical protein
MSIIREHLTQAHDLLTLILNDESFLKCVESFYSDFTGYNEKSSKFARDNFGWNSVINDLLSKLESTL